MQPPQPEGPFSGCGFVLMPRGNRREMDRSHARRLLADSWRPRQARQGHTRTAAALRRCDRTTGRLCGSSTRFCRSHVARHPHRNRSPWLRPFHPSGNAEWAMPSSRVVSSGRRMAPAVGIQTDRVNRRDGYTFSLCSWTQAVSAGSWRCPQVTRGPGPWIAGRW